MSTKTAYNTCVIVSPRHTDTLQKIADSLAVLEITRYVLIADEPTPETIIARADAEGGVPILSMWSDRKNNTRYLIDLMNCDTLPGRPHLLLTQTDDVASVAAEELERSLEPEHVDRILICSLEALELESSRELLRLHLSHTCASYLGRVPSARGVDPARTTDIPVGERNVNNIERRVMQCGMFKVKTLRCPRF